jgi:hypothetical protein
MADSAENHGGRRSVPWRPIGWGGIGALLLIPLIARFPWSLGDFVFAGAIVGGAGAAIELGARLSTSPAYRGGVAVAVMTAVLLVWVNGAVGILGDADNPANLMFLAVILVAGLGSAIARFSPAGAARATAAAAAAQLLVGGVALAGSLGSPGVGGVYEVVLATTLFGGLWVGAAALFRRAARDCS